MLEGGENRQGQSQRIWGLRFIFPASHCTQLPVRNKAEVIRYQKVHIAVCGYQLYVSECRTNIAFSLLLCLLMDRWVKAERHPALWGRPDQFPERHSCTLGWIMAELPCVACSLLLVGLCCTFYFTFVPFAYAASNVFYIQIPKETKMYRLWWIK